MAGGIDYGRYSQIGNPIPVYDSEGKLLYWQDEAGYQLTPDKIGNISAEGGSSDQIRNAFYNDKKTPWDILVEGIHPWRGQSRQQVDLDSLSSADKATLESAFYSGQLKPSQLYESANSYILRAIGPEAAAKYGITPQSVILDNNDSLQAHEWRKDQDFSDNNAMNKQALISIGSILGGGLLFGAGGAGAGAGAGEAGAAVGAGEAAYTGTSAELAADGLGGVDMWGSFGAGDAAAGTAGTAGTAYYDAGAGMWVDSSTGAGISSGTSVPAGYTAAQGSAAIAAGDAAAGAAGTGAASGSVSSGTSAGTSAGTSTGSSGLLSDGTIKAGTALIGGLLGGTNGAKQAGTTTTTTAPWTSQQPYLLDVFNQAKAASQGSPLTQKANQNYASVLSGPTSNPMLGLDNPYLQQSIDYANADVNRAMMPAMTAANRASGSYGNSGVADTYSKGLLDAYSRNATNMRMTDYTNQQNLQQQAVNNTLNYTQNANQWNAEPSKLYGQTVQGSYGSTSSTPYYENKYANILGGISTGLGLYNAYAGSK